MTNARMANCCTGFTGCISKTLMAAIRVLLFISCVILFLAQLVNLAGTLFLDDHGAILERLLGYRIGFTNYLSIIFMTIMSLIGAHGTYSKDPRYLKAFAIVALIVAGVHVFMDGPVSKNEWPAMRARLNVKFEEFATDYQWDRSPYIEKNEATKAWDFTQKAFSCCGMNSPKDWSMWKTSQRDTLPDSCCVYLGRSLSRFDLDEPPKCTLKYSYDDGCLDRFDDLVRKFHRNELITAIFYFILFTWALLLARETEVEISLANSPNAPTTHYQQFDGSVYIRQPAADSKSGFAPGTIMTS